MQVLSRPAQPTKLPELRQDVQLHRGLASDGRQNWLVYDPVRHRYFQISHRAFRLLSIWQTDSVKAFCAYASSRLEPEVSVDEVNELATFILASNLAAEAAGGDATAYARQEKASRPRLFWRVIHNYIFFRVPLVRPHRFLVATLPFVAPLFSRGAALLVISISLVGLYFASRQWDQFVATFLDLLSLEGMFFYGLTLAAVKTLHELGHAYVATRYGVRVNTMGVAFIVFMPILYTDVTDAWRLSQLRHKLAIDAAGIIVEFSLAGMALFLWAFLPDGPVRSAAFITATTSLILGLTINLNPLMRFDGYYLLSDAWKVPNLQARSGALARWWLREKLFSLGDPPPEVLAPRKATGLITYAIATFIYRQFVFIGIALVVFHMFFKVLGVILFSVEILWFIVLPIMRELKEWWHMRARILSSRRSLVSAAVLVCLLALFMVPWNASVAVQAVAFSEPEFVIFAPTSSQVVENHIKDGATIKMGSTLLVLKSPDLEHEIRRAKLNKELTQMRLQRIAGDAMELSDLMTLKGELARNQEKLAGLEKEKARLVVRASHDGVLRDVDYGLNAGDWIDKDTPIARLVTTSAPIARGYIDEDDLWRLAPGADATFVPEDLSIPLAAGKVMAYAKTGSQTIQWPYLASVYGGAMPSDFAPNGSIVPRSGKHLVRVKLDRQSVHQAMRGTLHIAAQRESIAAAVWRQILRVLVREASA
ncbi:MAG: HlyD family efflux transporter periplasmic adaptor subunit [Hyphomicrobiaceae bacterium]